MNKNYYSFSGNQSLPLLHSRKSTAAKPSWLLGLMLLFAFFVSMGTNAQVTTNGGSGLNLTYPDLATAITALNGASITAPVIITLAGNETAPVGGYVVTAEGTAVNTIIIEGVASVITAPTPQVAGTLTDGIFKLVGADWITLRGFTMLENPANTTTAAGTNNMTEWGVALLYTSVTNGAQNNTIQNNTIDLDRTYQNTFGIYSNSTHTATLATTSATATGLTGGNHGLKVYSNIITDVNNGVVVIGPTAAADQNNSVDIGGNSLATANTITNYGTTGTFSGFANVSTGNVNGVLIRNAIALNISYNTITSSVGGVIAGAVNGISIPAFSNAPTGTFTNSINNNTISLRSGLIAGGIVGITLGGSTGTTTSTLNINNNDFNTFGHTVAGTGTITYISSGGGALALTTNINSNTFTNMTVNTTGSIVFITRAGSMPIGSSENVNNNSIVTGFSKTGAGGTVTFYSGNASSVNGSSMTNTGNNFSNVTVTGSTTVAGWSNTEGASNSNGPTKTITNNTFNNIVSNSTPTGTITGMSVNFSGAGTNVSSNTVSNYTGGAAITGINYGTSNGQGTHTVSSNTIFGFVSTGGATNGLICGGGGTVVLNFHKNKIYNLEVNNATGSVNGISVVGGTTVNLYNNIIGDLRTPLANASNPLVGINISSGTAVNVYYNTVNINGTSAGALFGSSAVFASTTPTVTLRNNIFVNNSTVMGAGLAAAYRRSGVTLTTYGATSNNNLYYASTVYTDGTNTDATLAAFKVRVAPRDSASVNENPTYVSTTGSNVNFLHIDTTVATQIESGGSTIATFTDDFDGDVRNASTPDIGADEFTGVLSDLTPPTIVYTQVSNTCTTGVRIISATITDASGVPTVGIGLPVAYYSINGGAYTSATGISMGAGVYNFSIATGSVVGDVVTYYFVAQDNAGTPNVSALPALGTSGLTSSPPASATPPTTPFTYTVVSPLGGAYTVGSGGNYTTLTAAVADYNGRCLSGPVTFTLLDATYPTETFPITIMANADASAVNTLTIKPNTGVTATLTGSNAVAIIKLDGADYVTIDGSNNGTASQDFTISNTNATTTSTVVWANSTAAGNGATFNTIKNAIITGNSPTTTIAGIITSGSAVGSVAEAANTGNVIQNNTISLAQYGVGVVGPAAFQSGTVITQNAIGTATNAISFRGIFISNDNNTAITSNTIQNLVTTSSSAAAAVLLAGTTTGVNIANNTIKNINSSGTTSGVNSIAGIIIGAGNTGTTVNANKITSINSTTAGGYGVRGMTILGTGTIVTNNMVADITNFQDANPLLYATIGISIDGAASNVSLYNNSVNLYGTHTGYATNTTGGVAACIFINTSGTGLDIRNNILSNSYDNSTNAVDKSYAIYTSAATNAQFGTIDYNDYYVTGNSTPGTPFLGYLASDRTTLADMIAGFGGNVNSINVAPVYLSPTDLHMDTTTNTGLDNLGTVIGSVTLDIDGDARTATPDMGADEFTGPLAVSDFDSTSFTFYPNPVKNVLNISYSKEMSDVAIFNIMGQQVFAGKINATTAQIDMSGLSNGAYFVKVSSENSAKTIKVIKK